MLWKALWALILGYTILATIQVLVTREQMAKALGEHGAEATFGSLTVTEKALVAPVMAIFTFIG